MFSFIAYIKFLFSSTNQHGVHSPFVYKYVTQCLYTKPKKSNNKTENVLLKSIAFFKSKNIQVHEQPTKTMDTILYHYPEICLNSGPYDLVYYTSSGKSIPQLKDIHNDTVLLISKIHSSQKNHLLWEQVKKMDRVKVTIDLFHCGLVFFRREQAKEHFKIRI